jgi:predicted transcriptional regulator
LKDGDAETSRRRTGGIKRANGALETEVLGVLWASEIALTPSEVQAALEESGVGELAYTTVATTLTRLLAKGVVEREAAGRAHIYRPTRDAADFAAEAMRRALDTAAGDGVDHSAVLQRFVAGLDPTDGAALRRLVAPGRTDGAADRGRRGSL